MKKIYIMYLLKTKQKCSDQNFKRDINLKNALLFVRKIVYDRVQNYLLGVSLKEKKS